MKIEFFFIKIVICKGEAKEGKCNLREKVRMETIKGLCTNTDMEECEKQYRKLKYSLRLICGSQTFMDHLELASPHDHEEAICFGLIKTLKDNIHETRGFESYDKFIAKENNVFLEMCVRACLHSIHFMECGDYNCCTRASVRAYNANQLKLELFVFLCDVIKANKKALSVQVVQDVLNMAVEFTASLISYKQKCKNEFGNEEMRMYNVCMYLASKFITCAGHMMSSSSSSFC